MFDQNVWFSGEIATLREVIALRMPDYFENLAPLTCIPGLAAAEAVNQANHGYCRRGMEGI